MTNNSIEMLDNYLMGKLSPEEVSSFEELLKSDPKLANEAILQKDIIEGISVARRAALKARLNNIEIPKAAWYSNPKTIGVGIGALVIAIIAFLLLPTKNSSVPVKEEVIATTPIVEEKESNTVVNTQSEVPQNEKAPKEAVASTSKAKVIANAEKQKQNNVIAAVEPTIASTSDNEDGVNKKSDEPEGLNSPNASASGPKTLNTETISDNPSFNYHYKRNETRLTLYGNFSEKAYEVIEINGKNGTTFYMYHNGSYFALPTTGSEVKPLSPLTDDATIKKLANLRKRK